MEETIKAPTILAEIEIVNPVKIVNKKVTKRTGTPAKIALSSSNAMCNNSL